MHRLINTWAPFRILLILVLKILPILKNKVLVTGNREQKKREDQRKPRKI